MSAAIEAAIEGLLRRGFLLCEYATLTSRTPNG
jgi:hypothetical protein